MGLRPPIMELRRVPHAHEEDNNSMIGRELGGGLPGSLAPDSGATMRRHSHLE
jgi:hypothetical protein